MDKIQPMKTTEKGGRRRKEPPNLKTEKIKKMYNKIRPQQTTLRRNTSYKGERLEEKIHRIVNNKEPIKDGAPRIYTERKDGVLPAYNIRTDRWEAAVEAMGVVDRVHKAKREERATIGEQAKAGMTIEGDGGAKPLQGT